MSFVLICNYIFCIRMNLSYLIKFKQDNIYNHEFI